jgi:hypothetical protein
VNPLLFGETPTKSKLEDLLDRADSFIETTSRELEKVDEEPVGNSLSEIDSLDVQLKKLLMELTIDYWNGGYRDIFHYQNLFPLLNIENSIEILQDKLDTNGLPRFEMNDSARNELDPTFVIACNIICDFGDKRGLTSKLKDVGVSTRHWNAWLNKSVNREYLQKRLDRVFTEDLEVNSRLSIGRLIESGDLQAIKFYYELTHKYRPQDAQIANLNLIMAGLMEVLAKHVTADVLTKIADEIDKRSLTA